MDQTEIAKQPRQPKRPVSFSGMVALALVAVIAFATWLFWPHAFSGHFVALVRHFDGIVRHGVRDLKEQASFWKMAILFLFSFVYGVIHSAGPGHGKAIVAAYFLRNSQPQSKAFTLAAVISTVHTLGAMGLSVVFLAFLKGTGVFLKMKVQGYLMGVSGLAILAIGLVLLAKKLFPDNRGKKDKGPGNPGGNSLLLGAAAGLVPCPVAMFLATFSIAQGIPLVGLVSVLGISLGMFALLSLIGFMVMKGRESLLSGSEGKFQGIEKLAVILEYASLSLIILIGGGMAATALL